MISLKSLCTASVIGLCGLVLINVGHGHGKIVVTDTGNAVEVKIDGKLFTHYDYSSYKKPIFYPLLGPDQIPITRNYPMKKVIGEADDHPHHKSVWLGHEISGVDFWSEKGGTVKLQSIRVDGNSQKFLANHDWIAKESGKTIVTDQLEVRFSGGKTQRIIDYRVEFIAPNERVVFEDTKEGLFAIRVHPSLRHSPDAKRGVKKVTGSMLNSEGASGKGIWGQKAKWVCYHGQIDGNECGIAIFDHPSNLRHPTTWHARDYGLLAANPFGVSYFQKAERGSGKYILEPGKKLALKYRLLLFKGIAKPKELEQSFKEFGKL